jgi:multiple sugar transport system substrate-binding protein
VRRRGRAGSPALANAIAATVVLSVIGTHTAAGATITVMTNPYIKAASENIAEAFHKQNPGVVVNVTMSPRDNDQALQKLLLGSLTGRPLPDAVVVNGNLARAMVDRSLAQPLPESRSGDGRSGSASDIRIGDKLYGLTLGLSMPVVLFNSKLLADVGIAEDKIPDDWDGILAVARKVAAAHSGVIGGFMEHDSSGAFDFITLVESFGGRMMSPDERKVAFDGSAGRKALAVLRGFGGAGQAPNDMSNRQARQAFDAGAIGVFVTVSSAIPPAGLMANKGFRVIARPFPIEKDGKLPMAGPILVMLSKNPAQRNITNQFMRFASGDIGQAMLAEGSGYIPSRPNALSESNLPVALKAEYGGLLNARLKAATPWYAFPGFNSVEISRLIEDNLEQVVTLEIPPDQALESMQRAVSPLLPTANTSGN